MHISVTSQLLSSITLRMSVANTLYILVYSDWTVMSLATWTIFRREDVPLLRGFLREKHPRMQGDVIHDRLCHLTDEELQELRGRGVFPFVTVQKAGFPLMIPAGCAYQVSGGSVSKAF